MSEAATPSARPATGQSFPILEALLRLCAAEDPRPWYPRAWAKSAGMSPERMYYFLENLWLDGLVQKAEGTAETGPGMTLTPLGREVLDDPAALQRLREGRAVKPGDAGGVVREAIRRQTRPTVTLGLIAVNAAAFVYTAYLASRMGILSDFIGLSPFAGGNAAVGDVIVRAGGVYGEGWLAGQWWRLLTSCFIHIGVLHILANMYALYRVGGEVERWWGPVRYLVIYLFAGLGGSCLALALEPRVVMAGASGAICGVLGAAAVWVLCNGRHLPRSLAGQIRGNMVINAVLITFISLMPGVSWQGHLGGAVIGAAVALVMQAQRFGPSPWRWAALAALVPLPWLGRAFINHEMTTNPEWIPVIRGADVRAGEEEEERKAFQDAFVKRIHDETNRAYNVYRDEGSVLDLAPAERKPEDVDRVKAHLAERREDIKKLAADLFAAGPYKDEAVENARKTAIQFVQSLNDLLTTAEKRLREGEEWTDADQSKVQKVKDAADAWFKLLK